MNDSISTLLKFGIRLLNVTLGVLVILIMAGCIYVTRFKSSEAAIGDEQQPHHYYKIPLSGIDLQVRPYNDIESFRMFTIFFAFPLYLSEKNVPIYSPKPFSVLIAFLPLKHGFSFKPSDIALHLEGKDFKPSNISTQLVPDPGPGTEFYKREVAQGRVYCGSNKSGEYHPIANDANYVFSKVLEWYCYEIQFDVTTPDPSTEYSISLTGLLLNGAPYEIPIIPFHESRWQKFYRFP